MAILECNVSSCVHNESDRCCRGKIEVEGQEAVAAESTCCASYDKRGCGCTNAVKNPDEKTDIHCKAVKCIYNDDCRCTAGHVGVSGSNAQDRNETECKTFTCNCR